MTLAWRPMRGGDLPAVLEVANRVHPELPESEAVFAERLALFPRGCLVLSSDEAIEGYTVSHPILRFEIPRLNSMIGRVPADANDYYIHDVAIVPTRRRAGRAAAAVEQLLEIADGYETSSLVSVYGTADFWTRFGFRPAAEDMGEKLTPYGANAVYMLRMNEKWRTREDSNL